MDLLTYNKKCMDMVIESLNKPKDLTCPRCGTRLNHFSGNGAIPEYWYCPECESGAYNDDGEYIGAIR